MFGPVLHPASRRKGVVKRHPPVTAAHASAVDLVKMRRITARTAKDDSSRVSRLGATLKKTRRFG